MEQLFIALEQFDYTIVATYNFLHTASRLVQAGMGFAVYINEIIDKPKLSFLPFQTGGVTNASTLFGWNNRTKPPQKNPLEMKSRPKSMKLRIETLFVDYW
ncbi:hypothetical protein [Streptococcus sp. DD12]|uniref:hypothetical protein n=1 Tax=Streptococcus sp. DD12 TaxID=1777880 RepID=UPI000798415D|nr:hypothetical protein [Streptococcus sp. DD12]KXT75524.1 hypothetical protein STRDD12_01335 [Streptococcus sp. DD12]